MDERLMVCIVRLYAVPYAEFECEDIWASLKRHARAGLNQDIEFSIDDTMCGN